MKFVRNKFASAAISAVAILSLAACGAASAETTPTAASLQATSTTATALATTSAEEILDGTHADANDGDYDESAAATIALADGSSTASADGVTADGVTIDNDTNTVTITTAGTYILSGSLTDGQVVVNSSVDGKVIVVLDGVDITSSTTSPLVVTAADEAVVVLADGSQNTLSDGAGSASDDDETDAPNATIFSMADLTIAGSGSLVVAGVSADGIASKDGLVILAGDITVEAADDGIRGKDYLVVADGSITVSAGGDAVKSSDGTLAILDGSVTVKDSSEGLEAVDIVIDGGTIDVTSSDDAINGSAGDTTAEPSLTINGGTITVDSEGDGLDVNGSLLITGGTTTVNGPTMDGNGALDVDGDFSIEGGTLIAAGSSGMAMAPSTDSPQAWVSVTFDSVFAAGSTIDLVDADGTPVATFTTAKDTASLVLSSADISADGTYSVQVDGTEVTTVNAMEHTGGGMGGGMGGDHGGGPGNGQPPSDQQNG